MNSKNEVRIALAFHEGADRKTMNKTVNLSWYRVQYDYSLQEGASNRYYGRWQRRDVLEGSSDVDLKDLKASINICPKFSGTYRLVAENGRSCPVAIDIQVRGPGILWQLDSPRHLDLQCSSKSLSIGGNADLELLAPFDGKALVSIVKDRILSDCIIDVKEGKAKLSFPISAEWSPNVYVSAMLIRPAGPEEIWKPHRASGILRLDVEVNMHKLDLVLKAPQSIRSMEPFSLSLDVKDAEGQAVAGAAVMVAAVDEGVIALSNHPIPDPFSFFYSPRRLGLQFYDIYDRLAPELNSFLVHEKPKAGGGQIPNTAKGYSVGGYLNAVRAKRVKTPVFFRDGRFSDAEGKVEVAFAGCENSGRLRIVAVASSGSRFGSAKSDLILKNEVMVRSSWPRFAAPGDRFDLPLELFNNSGTPGNAQLTFGLQGPLELSDPLKPVSLPGNGRISLPVGVRTLGVGKATARILVHMGNLTHSERTELPIRPASAFERIVERFQVQSGNILSLECGSDFLAGTGNCLLKISAHPLTELSESLDYLLQYPYGCVEQSTSRMLPLIYLSDLATIQDKNRLSAEEVQHLMELGLTRLLSMQTHSGGLSMWPGGRNPYDYGSVYAAFMISEARRAGFEIPESLKDPLLDYLEGMVENNCREDTLAHSANNSAFALYVLAREGRNPAHWLDDVEVMLKEVEGRSLGSTYSGWIYLQLARHAIDGTVSKLSEGLWPQKRSSGEDLDSPLRSLALKLCALLEISPQDPNLPALVQRLKEQSKKGRWANTQENAFALLAMGKYARTMPSPLLSGNAFVRMPDGTRREFSPISGFSTEELKPG
ncbi:MAG: hypothetical protein HQL31_05195, partial [Planctomycetes bacterium]|nr:hypothetical protein [Planctomycetota bacterium]